MGSTGWGASVLHNVAGCRKRATEAPESIRGECHVRYMPTVGKAAGLADRAHQIVLAFNSL